MGTVGVRYIVDDVDAAITFYTGHLGFVLEAHPAPPFAILRRGDLRLMLSGMTGPGGGAQAMPDGARPQPGGWNRIQLQVDDLATEHAALQAANVRLRSDVITGIGGKQLLVEDPAGNLVELFEARRD